MRMDGFLSGKQLIYVAKASKTAFMMKALSMLFLCGAVAFFSGCKRRKAPVAEEPALEVVYTNRMDDPVYRKDLGENRLRQARLAGERSEVVSVMEKMVAEARAALPEGADDETVKAELEKRPEWKALEGENERMIGEIQKTLEDARETVRKRLVAEKEDLKAVAEGRAVPVAAGTGKDSKR